MPPSDIAALIERIHATAPQLVMEFAGAGARALAWLHAVPGSSRTILEATDRYTPASLAGAVGFTPKRFTSVEVARALAHRARNRAEQLAEPGVPVFGVGLTATIATDRAKRGDHRCAIGVSSGFGTVLFEIVIEKGSRDRAQEEELVSRLALHAIAAASGLTDAPLPPLTPNEQLSTRLEPAPELAQLERGERSHVLFGPDGRTTEELPAQPAILSGSFNPVHAGHLQLAEAASAHLGRPAVFELPLRNADKAAIDLLQAWPRAAQFLGRAPLLLTLEPLFVGKARLFPHSVFVVGADTAARLLSPRFYTGGQSLHDALEGVRRHGNRFLVAGRYRDGRYVTLADLDVPAGYEDLFLSLPEDEFRLDISSSQLRRERGRR